MRHFLLVPCCLALFIGCGGSKPVEPVPAPDVVPDRNFDEDAESKALETVAELGGRWNRTKAGEAVHDLTFKNVPLKDNDLELLKFFPHLTGLIVQDCPGFRGTGLKHLSNTPKLQFLTLAGQEIQGNALAELSNTPKLRSLTLARMNATPAELQPITWLKQLQTLELAITEITEAHLNQMELLPELMELYLKGNGLTREATEAFASRVNAKRPKEKPRLEVVFLP